MRTDPNTLAKALDWVNRRRKEQPPIDLLGAVDEAAQKFDLGPLDAEWLLQQARRPPPPSGDQA